MLDMILLASQSCGSGIPKSGFFTWCAESAVTHRVKMVVYPRLCRDGAGCHLYRAAPPALPTLPFIQFRQWNLDFPHTQQSVSVIVALTHSHLCFKTYRLISLRVFREEGPLWARVFYGRTYFSIRMNQVPLGTPLSLVC